MTTETLWGQNVDTSSTWSEVQSASGPSLNQRLTSDVCGVSLSRARKALTVQVQLNCVFKPDNSCKLITTIRTRDKVQRTDGKFGKNIIKSHLLTSHCMFNNLLVELKTSLLKSNSSVSYLVCCARIQLLLRSPGKTFSSHHPKRSSPKSVTLSPAVRLQTDRCFLFLKQKGEPQTHTQTHTHTTAIRSRHS